MVNPDATVLVKAPRRYQVQDKALLQQRLKRKLPWIIKQLHYFKNMPPPQPPRSYVSGETHYYLGRQYRLKINAGKTEHVKKAGRFLYVYVSAATAEALPHNVAGQMKKWYAAQAGEIITEKLDNYDALLKSRLPLKPQLQFRWMQKRWGSCSAKGTITINYELIKTPLSCIEYVVLHELCHLKYSHHGKPFYSLLTAFMPDWKQRKERLEAANYF